MKQCGCSKKFSCGCCEGVEVLTPQPTANRPGLDALRCRIGTHATFFGTMQARLSNFYLENSDANENPSNKIYPLKNLKTRLSSDPAIAMLSAAATMFDVLTFYQERIANEGFLRTATERRSVLELGRLVGYTPRPGVAASVYLAYTLDEKSDPVEIPAGALAQSIPMQNELPQSFETSEKLAARKEWNNLQPRLTQPQKITFADALTVETFYFEGTDTKLKINDPLLFVFEKEKQVLRRVKIVTPQFENKVTQVTLQAVPAAALAAFRLINLINELRETVKKITDGGAADIFGEVLKNAETLEQQIRLGSNPLSAEAKDVLSLRRSLTNENQIKPITPELQPILDELGKLANFSATPTEAKIEPTNLNSLFKSLLVAPSVQPANSLQLGRSPEKVFSRKSDISINDISIKLLANFHPQLKETLYPALSKATVSVIQPELKAVYALRVIAPLFGYNAQKITFKINTENEKLEPLLPDEQTDPEVNGDEHQNQLFLDNAYEQITASDENKSSYIVINQTNESVIRTFRIKEAEIRPRTAYGLSGKTTEVILDNDWRVLPKDDPELKNERVKAFDVIRETIVYAQSEQLTLADEPIKDVSGDKIELGALYEGLEAGRWIIVSGERINTDTQGVSGVMASELVMLAGIEQSFDPNITGDKFHTTLDLFNPLAYRYKRKTVKIYGNVVKATHGETRNEVLGSGNAAQATQTFTLKQPPLTFVSSPTVSGIESTLQVHVNDVEWKETDSLAELDPQDRRFITKIDDEAQTSVIFGNGTQGARLPTGIENIRAVYRNGIGQGGNVRAEQISLLLTKPLGVKEVINPLRASGGAEKETRDQARRNVPIALMALDRLVSTNDYADFARTFAGIGKSSAVRLLDGRRRIVHLTIAGSEDVRIDVNSELYHNLRRALSKHGDAFQPVQVVERELLALVISANIRLLNGYLWEEAVQKIRAVLLETFSFERRELGQSVFLSEVVSVIQNVKGVAYSDIDVLDGISETELGSESDLKKKFEELQQAGKRNNFVKAELARKNKDFQPEKDLPQKSIFPAQLAYLTPDVPDTLILNKIEEVKK